MHGIRKDQGHVSAFNEMFSRKNSRNSPPSFGLVLVGEDWIKKNEIGNTILRREVFETKNRSSYEKNHTTAFTGYVSDRCISVVNAAEMFTTHFSDDVLKQRVSECRARCAPGRHALVLVINGQDFDEKRRQRMEAIVNFFSENAFQHSVVFLYNGQGENNRDIDKIISACEGRVHQYSPDDQAGALNILKEMIACKSWSFLCNNAESSQKVNLVLCGSDPTLKSTAADLILGLKEQTETSTPLSACERREGEACGRHINLVMLPELEKTGLSEEEIQQMLHFFHLCDPGVNAFFLVTPQGPPSKVEEDEYKYIQQIKADKFLRYLSTDVTEDIDSSQKTGQATTEKGVRQVHITRDRMDVKRLLDEVEEIKSESGLYTAEMYLTALVTEMNKQLRSSSQGVKENAESLRIVLLGKTGEGKSATGNTILRNQIFEEDLSLCSVTTVCQKETGEVNGRPVTVVDTPGLFDTDTDNEEISKEIVKCIGMSAPGPHVFLLVLGIKRYTKEEKDAVQMIQDIFGEESGAYMILLFTGGDQLKGKSFEPYLKNAGTAMNNLLHKCGRRYHVINNKQDKMDMEQVTELLGKIDSMVKVNGGSYYTNEMFEKTERTLKQQMERILKEREEEIEKEKEELQRKYESDLILLKNEMEESRRRQYEEKQKREAEFKLKEQEMKRAMEKVEEEERNKMEEQLRVQRNDLKEKQRKYEAKAIEERERNIMYLQDMHEKDKIRLKNETERAARKQAEEEFNQELDRKLKEAKTQGHDEGYKEGHTEGHHKGKVEGNIEGHKTGKQEGVVLGHTKGLAEGHIKGVQEVESQRTLFGKLIDETTNALSFKKSDHK